MVKLATIPITLDVSMRGHNVATIEVGDVPVHFTSKRTDAGAELKIDVDRLTEDIQRFARAALATAAADSSDEDHEAESVTVTKTGVYIEGRRLPVYLRPEVRVEQVANDLATVHLGIYAKTVNVEGLPDGTTFEYVDSRPKHH